MSINRQTRRDLVRDYKDQKSVPGVYAVRCAATGEVWVGGSPDLDKQWNRISFGLRTGGHNNRALLAAWTAHGADAVVYEILERIDDRDMSPMARADAIKARERHWLAALGAMKAVG